MIENPTPYFIGRYRQDSRTDRWSDLPAGELPRRQGPATAWTGQSLLAWGGISGGEPVGNGVSYTPPASVG